MQSNGDDVVRRRAQSDFDQTGKISSNGLTGRQEELAGTDATRRDNENENIGIFYAEVGYLMGNG